MCLMLKYYMQYLVMMCMSLGHEYLGYNMFGRFKLFNKSKGNTMRKQYLIFLEKHENSNIQPSKNKYLFIKSNHVKFYLD